MSEQPNILVIMADDLGFGDIGFYNYGATQTPAIDSLAADGTSLTQHYSASPICAPARAAFLTGRYPQRTGVIDTLSPLGLDRIARRERTMGDLLREAGYVTGLIGKWHSGALAAEDHPNRRGFDEFIGFRGGVQDYWNWVLDRDGSIEQSDGRYLTDVFTEEALAFIRRHRSRRWFLYLNYTAPHGPFQARADDLAAFGDQDGTPDTVRTIGAMVAAMDRGIGRVLDLLDAEHLADDTLVMFTSDNGPWMRPGSFEDRTVRYNLGLARGKEHVYEGGIRVPVFLRLPGRIPERRVLHDFSHFTDWVPTLLGMLGRPGAQRLPGDGVDLWPALTGGWAESAVARCWQWSRYQPLGKVNAAIREGRWKLLYPAIDEILQIRDVDRVQERLLLADPSGYAPPGWLDVPSYGPELPRPAPQLFDVVADPGEQLDLRTARPDVFTRLDAKLAAWFEEVEAERRRIVP